MTRRVLCIEIDEEEQLTATVREVAGTAIDDDITVDLLRHKRVREQVAALADVVLEYRENAEETNCGTCVGACCMKEAHSIIHVTRADAKALAKHLNVKLKDLVKKHLTPVESWQDTEYILQMKAAKKAVGEACCTFLKVDSRGVGRCTVYDVRPRGCREFPAYNCHVYVPLKKSKSFYRND